MEINSKRVLLLILFGFASLPALIGLIDVSGCTPSGWWAGLAFFVAPWLALLAFTLWLSVKPVEAGLIVAVVGTGVFLGATGEFASRLFSMYGTCMN